MSQDLLPIDPRALKIQNYSKVAGAAVVAGVASVAVIAVGTSLVAAAGIAVAALVMVNFVVPVAARAIALWRVRAMTKLTEAFSEETIRDDEKREGERIKIQEDAYIKTRASLEAAIEDLSTHLEDSKPEEQDLIRSRIAELQEVVIDAESRLRSKKENFAELQRKYSLLVSLHRAGQALKSARQDTRKNVEQIQQVQIAIDSIKNNLRAEMAGKAVERMDEALRKPLSISSLIPAKGTK